MRLEEVQEIQENQENLYKFPYHYVVQYENQFSLALVDEWGLNYASAIEFILQKVGEKNNNQSIIDIGCGDGRLTRELIKKFPKATVMGIDYSTRSIHLAKLLNDDFAIKFEAINILHRKLRKEFDSAVLMEVFEHIEPKSADIFLENIRDLLTYKGVLHLTVPHKNVPVAPHHFRHFTVKGLLPELENCFDIIEVIPFERKTYLRKWIMRSFINKFFILNHPGLKNSLYSFYKRNFFLVEHESQCQRIYVKCRKR